MTASNRTNSPSNGLARPILVQKFGGTSVGSIERIQRVAGIIQQAVQQGYAVVTVVSAMGDTTDDLVALAQKLLQASPIQSQDSSSTSHHLEGREPKGREYDALLATGEMISTALLAMALNQCGQPAVGLNGWQAGIQTEAVFNKARIRHIHPQRIQTHLNSGQVVIVTGFQGIDENGDITTLGRGGSDTSAVALAAALNAERCDIYTDVRGVFSTDPRIVPHAIKQERVAYIEMLELARVGAKVLHPRAVETARHGNVKLYVRSTFNLDDPGTLITGAKNMIDSRELEARSAVTGIACDEEQVRIALVGVPDRPGIAAEVFGSLAQHHVSVDMIIQSLSEGSTNDIAFTIQASDLPHALTLLEALKAKIGAQAVLTDANIAKVSIVGAQMIDQPGIAAGMFEALSRGGINIKMISTSEIKISCLVDKTQAKEAVRQIHQQFFPTAEPLEAVLVDGKVGY